MAVLAGCSASEKAMDLRQKSKPEYSIIYIIHADASYSYHINGKRYQADEEVLSEAKQVAAGAKKGEVFIFHQKREKKILGLFSRKDRRWYHYKNGRLAEQGKYSPEGGGLRKEAEIYQNKSTGKGNNQKVMLYFGHEVPSETSLSYHQSRPEQSFDTELFSSQLPLFESFFDLLVLSTCNNGNPLMMESLHDKAKYVVASPRNLHLSHLSSRKLQLLESQSQVSTEALSDSIAVDSFEYLSSFLQTRVTVGVYDIPTIHTYLPSYAETYEEHLQTFEQKTLFRDNTDCVLLDSFKANPIPERGTKLYHKQPAFGVKEKQAYHSPWGCRNASQSN